ncbi:prephenate dehydratase [Corynebacterium doosanense]|uniref:Prephenate dehydratase n=1 Tax=Corynebacterium doosanense CAU 212 = DSM 45436 TaxID=558173 RepID=A0A097IIR9_9CORY|nr:prephenate dehydratase [Corynebacterium doosanense]AIT62024.1 prephenate dehydratase [Corynebacterium doosanense CAU 212 = DSM 45436]
MTFSVAYLGPAGTFTEAALTEFSARGVFGSTGIQPLPVASPAAALDAVRSGQADYAVVAIENSVDGAVTGTYDALVDGGEPVQIFHELELEVAFSIMLRPGTALSDVRTFATHPIAHQQVRRWLAENLPNAEFLPASSNAAAAEMVANGQADAAAAPARAAEIFGLERVADSVADRRGARTRFVVVGKRSAPTPRTGNDTTLVVFTLPHEPGTLVASLQDFALRGIDLSRIASRPTRDAPGTYLFYVDFIGHIDDQPLAEALRALWLRAENIRFLGSWPSVNEEARAKSVDLSRIDAASAWVDAARRGEEI